MESAEKPDCEAYEMSKMNLFTSLKETGRQPVVASNQMEDYPAWDLSFMSKTVFAASKRSYLGQLSLFCPSQAAFTAGSLKP